MGKVKEVVSMATSSFTKKYSLDKTAARRFIKTLTEETTVKEKNFDSKFKHVEDSKLVLNALSRDK